MYCHVFMNQCTLSFAFRYTYGICMDLTPNHGRFGQRMFRSERFGTGVSGPGHFGLGHFGQRAFRRTCRLDARDQYTAGLECILGETACVSQFQTICDRVKMGRDRRSRPTFTRSHVHSFALRTTARRRTPGSRTATNSRAGCSEPAVY